MVQPTYITNQKRFVHVDCQSFSQFDFKKDTTEIEVREAFKSLYIGQCNTYESLMKELTALIGRQPKLPGWVFDGMILGIQDGTQICNLKLETMKQHDAKICGIWAQDWEGQRITSFGKQLFWDWKYDTTLYAQLPEMIKEWYCNDVKFLGYINPFLAIEGSLYKKASENGYLVKDKMGKDYMVTITTFPAAMIDLTNPDACTFMKEVIKKNMIQLGLRGWMADFAEYLPTDAVLFSGEDARLVHNLWPVLWAKLNEEAVSESGLTEDILFFVRAGYTGTGKHAKLLWNGDQHVDWSRDFGIGSIVNSALSLSVLGMGNSHSDIGGYTTFGKMTRSKELLLRWTELSAFSMVMRSHEGNQPEKNHQFDSDEETIDFVARFTRIYHHLKPYHIYVDHENSTLGMPSIRPVFFHYEAVPFFHEDGAYMLGRDLIIYPIVEQGMNHKLINLPKDNWIHVFTGDAVEEINISVDNTKLDYTRLHIPCPIGTPIVFYRKESEFSDLFSAIKEM